MTTPTLRRYLKRAIQKYQFYFSKYKYYQELSDCIDQELSNIAQSILEQPVISGAHRTHILRQIAELRKMLNS